MPLRCGALIFTFFSGFNVKRFAKNRGPPRAAALCISFGVPCAALSFSPRFPFKTHPCFVARSAFPFWNKKYSFLRFSPPPSLFLFLSYIPRFVFDLLRVVLTTKTSPPLFSPPKNDLRIMGVSLTNELNSTLFFFFFFNNFFPAALFLFLPALPLLCPLFFSPPPFSSRDCPFYATPLAA